MLPNHRQPKVVTGVLVGESSPEKSGRPTGAFRETSAARRGRRSKLVQLLSEDRGRYERMLALIREGAYLRSAAQAIGVAPETVSRWLARGSKVAGGPYRQFRQDVVQAVAVAAVSVEIELRRTNPLVWLRCGPRRLLGDGLWRNVLNSSRQSCQWSR